MPVAVRNNADILQLLLRVLYLVLYILLYFSSSVEFCI